MHELSLAEHLWTLTSEVARTENLKRINSLKISLGECLAVVPESLHFCWDAITEGTIANGSKIELHMKKPFGICKDCGSESALERPLYLCKNCGSSRVDFKTGREFVLESIEAD